MSGIVWAAYVFPAIALILALAGLLYVRHNAREFDRKYGKLLASGRLNDRPYSLHLCAPVPDRCGRDFDLLVDWTRRAPSAIALLHRYALGRRSPSCC